MIHKIGNVENRCHFDEKMTLFFTLNYEGRHTKPVSSVLHSFFFTCNGPNGLFNLSVAYKPLLVKQNGCKLLKYIHKW